MTASLLISVLWVVAIAAITLGIVFFALNIFSIGGQPRQLILGGVALLFLVWILAILLGAASGPRFGAVEAPPATNLLSESRSLSPDRIVA